MKTTHAEKRSRDNGYESDDERVRYKLNEKFNSIAEPQKKTKKTEKKYHDDDNTRYKLAPALLKSKLEVKPKTKNKIKVNFWSNKDKQSGSRLHSTEKKSIHRHSVAATVTPSVAKAKSTVKVVKRVSFLPTPIFFDNHIPMVTVPDDLTIQLNEEEANDLHEDLNHEYVNNANIANAERSIDQKRKSRKSFPQTNQPINRKRSHSSSDALIDGNANELEFFSKYVVQKLRKMETNQRIYSENLINTVLMLGQLGKLNGKSKVGDAYN